MDIQRHEIELPEELLQAMQNLTQTDLDRANALIVRMFIPVKLASLAGVSEKTVTVARAMVAGAALMAEANQDTSMEAMLACVMSFMAEHPLCFLGHFELVLGERGLGMTGEFPEPEEDTREAAEMLKAAGIRLH